MEKWLSSTDEKLDLFKLNQTRDLIFTLTEKQYRYVQDKVDIFGTSATGKSMTIKRIPLEYLWRHATVVGN